MDKLLNEFVKVYEGKYNFLVTIGDDVFEMSSNAAAPNGVNMYAGELSEYNLDGDIEIPLADCNEGLKRGIVRRIVIGYNDYATE